MSYVLRFIPELPDSASDIVKNTKLYYRAGNNNLAEKKDADVYLSNNNFAKYLSDYATTVIYVLKDSAVYKNHKEFFDTINESKDSKVIKIQVCRDNFEQEFTK